MSGLLRSKRHWCAARDERRERRLVRKGRGGRKPCWTMAVKTFAVKGPKLDKLLHACMLSLCVLAVFFLRPRGKLGESKWLQVMRHRRALNEQIRRIARTKVAVFLHTCSEISSNGYPSRSLRILAVVGQARNSTGTAATHCELIIIYA